MTVTSIAKLKKLAKECIEIDNMINSIKNAKHRNVVVPAFQQMKMQAFSEMEKIVLSEQETIPTDEQIEDVPEEIEG
jgi:isochorismate synthase EntC